MLWIAEILGAVAGKMHDPLTWAAIAAAACIGALGKAWWLSCLVWVVAVVINGVSVWPRLEALGIDPAGRLALIAIALALLVAAAHLAGWIVRALVRR